jgi:hypothetical protein
MARAWNRKQFGSRRDECHRGRQLVDGSEAIVRAVNEKHGSFEIREMRGTQLRGTSGRMERVGEQQEPIGESGFGGTEHRCLPSSVGMAAQKYTTGRVPPHGGDGRSEALLIAFRAAARRWPVRAQLAKGKIAAEDGEPRGAEGIRQRGEQRSVAVRSRAVGEDKAIAAGSGRGMQISPNGYFVRRRIQKFAMAVHTHRVLQDWPSRAHAPAARSVGFASAGPSLPDLWVTKCSVDSFIAFGAVHHIDSPHAG